MIILARPCSSPPDGTNTQEVDPSSLYEVGETYTYICEDGYGPSGDTVSTCLLNNQWTLSPPTCNSK